MEGLKTLTKREGLRGRGSEWWTRDSPEKLRWREKERVRGREQKGGGGGGGGGGRCLMEWSIRGTRKLTENLTKSQRTFPLPPRGVCLPFIILARIHPSKVDRVLPPRLASATSVSFFRVPCFPYFAVENLTVNFGLRLYLWYLNVFGDYSIRFDVISLRRTIINRNELFCKTFDIPLQRSFFVLK